MTGVRQRPLRVGLRFIRLGGAFGVAALDYFFRVWLRGRSGSGSERTAWMRRHSGRILRVLNLEASYAGQPPTEGMLVCNHLSYLDILVLGQRQPLVFVSKADVRKWPVIGLLTACAGTLFLQRESRCDVVRVANAFAPLIEQGAVVAIFPEGTSSDGRQVLPFRSSLLEPAAANGWRVSPAWITYALDEGAVEDEVCYWRDMSFGAHLLNLLSKNKILAFVAYGEAVPRGSDRKELAGELHQRVRALAEQHGHELANHKGAAHATSASSSNRATETH